MASVSVTALGKGRYRIRWREKAAGPGGEPFRKPDGRWATVDRSLTLDGKEARDAAVARVGRDLAGAGRVVELAATLPPSVADLEQAAVAWLRYKATRCTASSLDAYALDMKRFFTVVRRLKGIAGSAGVSASVLSRDLLMQALREWQVAGLSESSVYASSRSVLEMWRWVADDPAAYAGVPTPPRESRAVLPRAPIYTAPAAPTLAECDAALRHLPLAANESRRIGAFLRYTGLRIHQVLAMRRRDLDFDRALLTVSTGKSRAEKAEMRTMPVARALVAESRGWFTGLDAGDFLFPAWGIVGSARPAAIRPGVFHDAWALATRAGEVREGTWRPPNRKAARPEHAFRAAFQSFLRGQGVTEPVIDALVGHHGKTVRSRHYVGIDDMLPQLRAAVDLFPPVDWQGKVEGGTVLALAGGRARPG